MSEGVPKVAVPSESLPGNRGQAPLGQGVPGRDVLRLQGAVIARAGSGHSIELEIRGERYIATSDHRLPSAATVGRRVGLELPSGGSEGRARLVTVGGSARPASRPRIAVEDRAAGTGSSCRRPTRRGDRRDPRSGRADDSRSLRRAHPRSAPGRRTWPRRRCRSGPSGRYRPGGGGCGFGRRPDADGHHHESGNPGRRGRAGSAGGAPAERLGADPGPRLDRSSSWRPRPRHVPAAGARSSAGGLADQGWRQRRCRADGPAAGRQARQPTARSRDPCPLDAEDAGAAARATDDQRRLHPESTARPQPSAPASEQPAVRAAAGLATRLLDLATGGSAGDDRAHGGSPAATSETAPPPASRGEPGSGFRVLDLAFGVAPDLVRLQLHLRRHDGRGEGGRERGGRAPSARAIFSADLDRLGRCQLDVLCVDRRFELTVRSARALPDEVRRSVAVLFLAARDIGGLRGEISFAPGALLDLPQPRDPTDARSVTA